MESLYVSFTTLSITVMEKTNRDIKDFVYYMTHSKSLTRGQQAKRDKLFARDYGAVKEDEEDSQGGISPSNKRTKYIPYANLREFLYRFNQDSILKYTCHEIDTDETVKDICEKCNTKIYSIKKHSEIISLAYKSLISSLHNDKIYIDKKMYSLILVYLTGSTKSGQKKWSSLNIDTNWASKDLLEWGNNNPGIIPSPGRNIAKKQRNIGYELPSALRSNLTGRRILTLNELVLYFKSLFHIRRDNSLQDILKYTNEKEGYKNSNINIVFSDTAFKNNIELFTDVDKLIQAYKSIIKICKKCHKEGDSISIELAFFEEGNNVYFCIHDINSIYGKSLKAASERIGEAQSVLIEKQINGLCDLYIEADFDCQQYARIALWNEHSHPLGGQPNIETEKIDICKGVKYILKF